MTTSPSRMTAAVAVLLAAVALGGCAHAPTDMPVPPKDSAASEWHQTVATIADAGEGEGRREAIEHRLSALSLDWQHAAFTIDEETGTNLLAPVSGADDAPLLLLGAHFDRVDIGQGATDNASGSAVVLALAKRLHDKPLTHHRVAVAFWDLEERGLLGSRAYVDQKREKPALYVNFDVFGWGDTIWMMAPSPELPIVQASHTSSQTAGVRLSAGEQYPPSDHRAFLKAGWPAVSYSLVGADEIDGILSMYAGEKPKTAPRVMQVIHSEHDTVEKIDALAVTRAVDVIEASLRLWDAMPR